ncbi:SDR family oxidoreductase [Aureimonas jatrophae]|uniref:NADP-dependent 3-hydroxy acid dehydrogenase YdfG n=1 Tax=Aureimonas jatrophae TaxID=1166073 RepID=A0A1H0FQW4_9HYPH|nr:SDR family oxidoreductase [Aureimonas jatrophae]MBB3949906.1 NAD(P)-dependent dehydrogenase (short-subunit alcohol dehydrogenase family) [Aureimonas jatrophae]SDN96922.1 NADP-dependent 3-hydroxy acid dehydrogenase YdfG [Aureimonas jatrophae]
MTLIALVTGASSGFGQMIARDLAQAGHTAYASMRGTAEKNAGKVKENAAFAREHGVDLRSIELDVQDEASVRAAVKEIIDRHGRIDVLVHNAGHMMYGPLEAFTPDQLAQQYDVNVLGTQRLNRAALPHMRAAGSGLVVWVSSTSVAGGVPPLLGPYFAAKAGMDALAVCYAKELAPLGIETAIVVPGAFTSGTNHFANAGHPDDASVAGEYDVALPERFAERIQDGLANTVPDDADPSAVGRAVVDIVAAPQGKRPLRTYVDPADDGAAVTFQVMDRVREQFLHRIGFAELLHPTVG